MFSDKPGPAWVGCLPRSAEHAEYRPAHSTRDRHSRARVVPGVMMRLVGALPSGTVSMLFTDVEQSTLLLTRLGRAYEVALDGCRAAQRSAWVSHGGVEMGTEGDSFFVVFSTAEDAVGAAVQAQVALSDLELPNAEQVLVRMGIHTGSPRIHDDGYVGI